MAPLEFLPLLLTILLCARAAAGASDRSSFDDASACAQRPPPRRTLTERVGGKVVRQEVALRQTAVHGCVWALPGGNRTNYTLAGRCLRVSATISVSEEDGAGGFWRSRAVAPADAEPADPRLTGKCRLRRSVDCRLHPVAFWDPRLPCDEAAALRCPQLPRLHWRLLAGRNVSQTLISLATSGLRARDSAACEWALLGGWAGDFTRWAGSDEQPCARCRGGGGGGGIADCVAPTSPPSPPRMGCAARLGPDCRLHLTAADDPEAACSPLKPAAASSVVGEGASRGSGGGGNGGDSTVQVAATSALLSAVLAGSLAANLRTL